MKPPVARILAVRHRKHVCLTASFLATGGFKFQLFQNICMVYKHVDVNTLLLLQSTFMLSMVKMLLKWEVGGQILNSQGNYFVDHGKSWNCVFEFLWEPCQIYGVLNTIGLGDFLVFFNLELITHDYIMGPNAKNCLQGFRQSEIQTSLLICGD